MPAGVGDSCISYKQKSSNNLFQIKAYQNLYIYKYPMLLIAIYFGTEYTYYGFISPSHISICLHTFKHICRGYLNISPSQKAQRKHCPVFLIFVISSKVDDMSQLNVQCKSRSLTFPTQPQPSCPGSGLFIAVNSELK